MSFEGEEDLDIEFGNIIPCDCGESSYGHVNALVDRDCSPRFSFWDAFRVGHFGDLSVRDLGKRLSREVSRMLAVWVHRGQTRLQSTRGWHRVCKMQEAKEGKGESREEICRNGND